MFGKSIFPSFGMICPEIISIKDDLPLPFGPISKIFSLSITSKLAKSLKEELLNFNEILSREIYDLLPIYFAFFS